MSQSHQIRSFQSRTTDAKLAVQEFHAGVVQPDMELVMFFCSPLYDLDVIAAEILRLFGAVQVIGCTTSGEIGPSGYCEHSLSGMSFPGASFKVVTGRIGDLQNFEIVAGYSFAQSLLRQFEIKHPVATKTDCFGLMLIDGLSVREEPVAHALQQALGNIPLIGGSAGDSEKFKKSYVYCAGQFHVDSVVLALLATDLPFVPFKTQHFVASDLRMVVTQAEAGTRVVREINGLPAAAEYARMVGVDPGDLDSTLFAASPVVVKIGGTDYVRSIQAANGDGSLTFYCAIEEGLVLRLAHAVDMIASLKQNMESIRNTIGTPQVIIACDCVLRSLEFAHSGIKEQVAEIYQRNHVTGFNSYGEQYLGIHVNQTLTGIAIGERRV